MTKRARADARLDAPVKAYKDENKVGKRPECRLKILHLAALCVLSQQKVHMVTLLLACRQGLACTVDTSHYTTMQSA